MKAEVVSSSVFGERLLSAQSASVLAVSKVAVGLLKGAESSIQKHDLVFTFFKLHFYVR
jgi:hypothetical protein